MNFRRHSELEGKHAFLGASSYHWLNYTKEKVVSRYIHWLAVQRGTELHELAAKAINLGVKLYDSSQTLNMYVNYAIGYGMTPEQPLYYSPFCFGTADSISFKNNFLRIHDLKTGVSRTSMHQLEIYAAIFCLEYEVDPFQIQMELRIYQNDEILVENPEPELIQDIMDKIVVFDEELQKVRLEG